MDIMCFFRKLFLDSAEPVQAYAQSLRDHNQFAIADRIIEILPGGIIDRQMTYDEYIDDESIDAMREKLSQ